MKRHSCYSSDIEMKMISRERDSLDTAEVVDSGRLVGIALVLHVAKINHWRIRMLVVFHGIGLGACPVANAAKNSGPPRRTAVIFMVRIVVAKSVERISFLYSKVPYWCSRAIYRVCRSLYQPSRSRRFDKEISLHCCCPADTR